MRFVKDKWFLACLRVPVLLLLQVRTLIRFWVRTFNVSVAMEQLNLYKSFWSMSVFKAPTQPVHSLHNHCLFWGCWTLTRSVSTSHAPTTVHAFCPSSRCSLFAKVTVSMLAWGLGDWQPWRTQRSSTALSALHSPWWLICTDMLPMPLLVTTLFAVCVVGGQSWLLRIWAHQYTHHLLSPCNVLNINTTCSLRNDIQ